MAALRSRRGNYVFILWFLLSFFLSFFFFSSPNLSRRRFDVCHTHGVALVRIYGAGLKRAAGGSPKNTGRKKSPKISHLRTIAQLCRATCSQLRHVSTKNEEKTCCSLKSFSSTSPEYSERRPTSG